MEEHTCLIRENPSNLLLNSSRESFQVDKGQSSFKGVTTLGPGNMALATPATVADEEQIKTKGKRRHEEAERPEEQVNYPSKFGMADQHLLAILLLCTIPGFANMNCCLYLPVMIPP